MNRIETLLAELDELKAAHAAQTEQIATLAADLSAANARAEAGVAAQTQLVEVTGKLNEADAALKTATDELAAARTRITELEASQSDFDTKLAAEVARLGLREQPVAEPKPGLSTAEIRETFKAMPAGPERSAFYQQHKDVLRYH